jgi:GT2 family glycosyltransferase
MMPDLAQPLVYIITLNWNQPQYTLACLASCCQQSYQPCRLLLVDNGSTDDSVTAVATHFPQVEQIVNSHNLGFAAAANIGLRHALRQGADYIFLINNDTTLAVNSLEILVQTAVATQSALTAPLIFQSKNPTQVWSAGGWRHQITLEIHRRPQPPFVPEAIPLDFVTACGLLISRACLQTIGFFDERFFMYYEDMDYCLRAQAADLPIFLVPQAHMWHHGAVSSGGQDSANERYHMARSSLLYFRKHSHGWRWLLVLLYRLGSAIKTSGRLGWRQQWSALLAYWQGLGAGVVTSATSVKPFK